MTPAKRLCGLLGLILVLAVPACHRRLPRPGKPVATPSQRAPAPVPSRRARP